MRHLATIERYMEEIKKLLESGMFIVMTHHGGEYMVTIADPEDIMNDSRQGLASARAIEDAIEAAVRDFYANGLSTVDIFGDIVTGES